MAEERDDREVEDLLATYRPASPSAALRDHILNASPAAVRPPLLPLAAGLVIAALLQWAAAQMDARTAVALPPEPDAHVEADVLITGALPERVAVPRSRVQRLDDAGLGLDGNF
jgi:hypothetical protein